MPSKKTAKPSGKNPAPPAASGDFDSLVSSIGQLVAPLQALHQQAVNAHAPTVLEILRTGSRDTCLIEHTLDHLLDHACIPEGLVPFKSLCRYYWDINPCATASYVSAYREMWDSDSLPSEAEASDAIPIPSNSTGLNLLNSSGLLAHPDSHAIGLDRNKAITTARKQP